MSFLQTSFKTGYITDLILPPVPLDSDKTSADVFQAGVEVALSMAQTPEQMSALNPFVYSVKTMAATDPHAVDAPALAAHFDVALDAPYAAGEFVHYEIKDKVPVALGWSADLVYYSAIRRTTEGIEALTNPGSGVVLHGKWMVKVGQADITAGGHDTDTGIGTGNGYEIDGNGDRTGTGIVNGIPDTAASTDTQIPSSRTPVGDTNTNTNNKQVINLLETNTISCSVLLAWFIKGSMDKAHRTAHRRFKELWSQKMAERGYPSA